MLPFRPKIEEKRLSEWLVKLYKIYQWYDVNAVCLNQYHGTTQPLRPIIYKWKEQDSGYTRKDENEKRNKKNCAMLAHNRGDDRPIKCSHYLWLPYFIDLYFISWLVGIMQVQWSLGYNAQNSIAEDGTKLKHKYKHTHIAYTLWVCAFSSYHSKC